MFSFWQKKRSNKSNKSEEQKQQGNSGALAWDAAATKALAQAVGQAPVPGIMKQRIQRELAQAAEEHVRNAGKTTVSAEDLMQGMMSRLPEEMRKKVEEAAKQGPQGLENLKNELK